MGSGEGFPEDGRNCIIIVCQQKIEGALAEAACHKHKTSLTS